ncbi:MAG: GTP-binding protein [Thermoguttaceae bacterium]|jgi:G3E family GTPase
MPATRLILVGGFLGSGKTTLLAQAAQRLTGRGKRVGLLANDQAADLVDTELFRETGAPVEEVAGGCFCCRFPDMLAALERLVEQGRSDVLLGEPVGSCTDLSATVMQPIKKLHSSRFRLAPFTVMVDGNQVRVLDRLRRAAAEGTPGRFPDNVLYIYQKQLEEADVIALNKIDLLPPEELGQLRDWLAGQLPGTPIFGLSARDGSGVDAWLDFVLQDLPAGQKITEVDYDTYAAGEAALGWMNARLALHARPDTDWHAFAGDFLDAVRTALRAEPAEIAHLKLYLTAAGGGHVVGNVTSNQGEVSVRGHFDPDHSDVNLLVNARVHIQPDRLRAIIENALQAVAAGAQITTEIRQVRSFFPGRPQPTHRFSAVEPAPGGG